MKETKGKYIDFVYERQKYMNDFTRRMPFGDTTVIDYCHHPHGETKYDEDQDTYTPIDEKMKNAIVALELVQLPSIHSVKYKTMQRVQSSDPKHPELASREPIEDVEHKELTDATKMKYTNDMFGDFEREYNEDLFELTPYEYAP